MPKYNKKQSDSVAKGIVTTSRYYKKRRPSKANAGFQALREIKNLRREMVQKEEVKYWDIEQASTTITSTAVFTSLSNPVLGSGAVNRIGDRITAKYITLKIEAVYNLTATSNVLRVIIFNLKSSATPNVNDILEQTSTIKVNSPYNKRPSYPFKILYDKRIAVNAGGPQNWVDDQSIKLNIPITFDSLGGGGRGDSQLWMLQVSDEATNGPTTNWITRMGFTDD